MQNEKLPNNLTIRFDSYCEGCNHGTYQLEVNSIEAAGPDGYLDVVDLYELTCEHRTACSKMRKKVKYGSF